MHVAIVLYPFGNASKGLEQSVFDSTISMLKENTHETRFTVFVKGSPDVSGLPEGTQVINLPNEFYWQWYLLRVYRQYDLFVFFTEAAPFFLWKKSLIIFYDAAYYYFGPTSFFARMERKILVWWRSWMMRASRHVVTISEASKRDLVNVFSIPSEHVSVIYLGFKSLVGGQKQLAHKETKPYFMYVGPLKERKNVFAIVEAFDLFRKMTGLPHELLLVGRKTKGEYEDRVYARIEASEYKESIIFKTGITDEDLGNLYTHAEALLFPSLLEGFGLPVLEALSLTCMVITSATTSTIEVLGDAGFAVDPKDISEIADAMAHVARHEYNRETFEKSAALQISKFSWEKTGQEWDVLFNKGAFTHIT